VNGNQALTTQCSFEEVTPFNPRGDGYQTPSSSSSGSAAAAAGYDWLDFTIGTDTGGSIRHPAGVNGVYGIRPSLGSVHSRGMTASSFMDTVGAFARSADILDRVQKVMISGGSPSPRSTPRYKLLYPTRSKEADPDGSPRWFPHPEGQSNAKLSRAENIFGDVVAKLETHLHCQRQIFNMDELWRNTHPETMDADLAKATATIYQKLVYRATAKDVIDPFIEKHKALHDGRVPFLEPVFRRRYEYGAQVTQSEFDAAVQDFQKLQAWLRNVLFSSEPDEVVILIFPQSWGTPNYRDESKATPNAKIEPGKVFWEGFSLYSISYASGCPDITVPVGQTPYQSRITEHEEWLPVSLSMLSQPGNDLVLTDLLKDLEECGVLRAVESGRETYKQ
jgi:Asp-tRNA(Asn)/Glu-tRNA(Gln) amidotransferase A subunit family amidase